VSESNPSRLQGKRKREERTVLHGSLNLVFGHGVDVVDQVTNDRPREVAKPRSQPVSDCRRSGLRQEQSCFL
jgi:hypothetical protein